MPAINSELPVTQHVKTRFAPSPTGFLHVGGVRTALFAWLVAKKATGSFILRIEDTDKSREESGSVQHIMDSLRWLGLQWDEGPDKEGLFGPYRQSERLDIYKQWAQKLIETGRAYADINTPQQLDELRQQAVAQRKPFLFREQRPKQSPPWDGTQPLRFKSEPKDYKWSDEVMGELSAGPETVDDFIIIKSDGFPTYNFAHIVDDHLMEITHVIRSQEFLPSVPKFLNLYEALGIVPPKLATLPYVLGPDGHRKLSKRDGAKDILDYKKEGYLPTTLINFLASLGWNDGSEQEIFSLDELIAKFDISRVQRSGARFDEQRLVWMNGQYIRQLSVDDLYRNSLDFWPASAEKADENYKKAILGLLQDRLKYFAELPELTEFFFTEPRIENVAALYIEPKDKLLKDLDPRKYPELLKEVIKELSSSDFSEADIRERLNKLLGTFQTRPGVLFSAVRIAVTGTQTSPELFGTLQVLGKESTLKRLNQALSGLAQKT